jgi:hypothetical protein
MQNFSGRFLMQIVLSAAIAIASPAIAATAPTISGTVSGARSITVLVKGPVSKTVITGANEEFTITGLTEGDYTLAPDSTGYIFYPASRAAIVSGTSLADVMFYAVPNTAPTYTLSGTVSGVVSAGVYVTLTGADFGSTATDAGGNYTFTGLPSGTYRITAYDANVALTASRVVTIGKTDATAINFTATNPVGTASPVMTTPSSLPDATVGASYTHTLVAAASGGKAPYHYECTSLDWWPPPGLTVDTNGNLTGTPTQAGTYGVAVDVVDANGNRSLSKTVLINVITPHAVTSIAPFWVYHNGVFAWGGDYSSGAVPNYTSTAGAPESGPYDIALSITGPWGVWAPYAGGSVPVWDFDASGYNYITMDLKPTVANQ